MSLRQQASAIGLKRTRWTSFKLAVAKRFGRLWVPMLYAGMLVGFLLARALPGGQLAPLGVAFYAAVRGSGFGASVGLPVALAVAVGSWTVLPLLPFLWVVLSLAVCHLASSVLRVGVRGPAPVGAALVAALCAGMTGLLLSNGRMSVSLAFWVALTGVLALVFTLGITDTVAGRLRAARPVESSVPALVILAAALSGLEGLNPVAWLSVRDVAASLLVLTCAYFSGPPLGAAAGGVLGMSFLAGTLGGERELSGILAAGGSALAGAHGLTYVVAGLLAGYFRELRKVGVGLAFTLGFIICAMLLIQNPTELFGIAYNVGVAILAFWILPNSWLANLAAMLGTANIREPNETSRRNLPLNLPERVQGIARVLREVGRTFDQVSAVETPPEQGVSRAFEQVADRVCRSCSMNQHCWSNQFHQTYQLFTDLWQEIEEEGALSTHPVPETLEQHCIKPDRVAAMLNYLYDLHRSRRHWERRLEEGRGVVGDYLKNMTRMLERFAEQAAVPDAARRAERQPVLRVQSAITGLPKQGSHISGDSYVGTPLLDDRYLLALSDGMGVGRGAALESKKCVHLLHEILDAGFSSEVAVNTVNSALLLRSPDETFATVDLALLDLTTGRTEFVKVGAAPSFIKRGPEVTVVKMPSVPVGIINQVDIEPEYRTLRPGDMVVMITDGIWDVSKDDIDKERWIINHLTRETAGDPEKVADSLLARARDLVPDAGDDMTVLVARVDSVTGASAESDLRPPATAIWKPAKRAPRISPSGDARK